jgi:hypothetical protein
MTNLQTTSDELKEASERGTPQESAQPEAAEATHRPASDFKASGLVLPSSPWRNQVLPNDGACNEDSGDSAAG